MLRYRDTKQVREQAKEIKSAYKKQIQGVKYAYYMQPIPNSCRSGQKKKRRRLSSEPSIGNMFMYSSSLV